MSSPEWLPSAERSSRAWVHGTMVKNTGALRVVLHDTENNVGTSPKAIETYMWNNGPKSAGGYHLLVPMIPDQRPLQLRPANVAAGSLMNNRSLARSPNKEGTRMIAISLICKAGNNHGLTNLGPWWPEILAWVRGFGVPDTIIDNRTPPGGGGLNKIPVSVWYSGTSGWCFHATAPNPTSAHWDPGKVDPAILFGGAGTTPPTPTPTPPSSNWDPNANFHRNMLLADPMMRGEDVKWCQANRLGVAADGIFGQDTKSATVSYQSGHGLAADGVIGPATAAAMGMPGSSAPTPPPSGGTLGKFPLASGHWYGPKMNNDKNHSGYSPGEPAGTPGWAKDQYKKDQGNIKKVQSKLKLSADGLYGNNTANAVKGWQSSHGLTADGLCGEKTWKSF